jgi:hypothetical protein
MASQNINQYVYPNWGVKLINESYDMSLTSDEQGYNQEVVFSPYLIAQTYGNKLPFYFDIDDSGSVQQYSLIYKHYNFNKMMHNNSKDRFQNQQYRDYIKNMLWHSLQNMSSLRLEFR